MTRLLPVTTALSAYREYRSETVRREATPEALKNINKPILSVFSA
jgi:hypothetical protein